MFFTSKQPMLGTLLCLVSLLAYAVPFVNIRIVTSTPRTTISALHELHALRPSQSVVTELLLGKNQDLFTSISGRKRTILELYDPQIFQPTPDAVALSKRVLSDLVLYQKERGLAPTGLFDAQTTTHLRQDDLDNEGLSLARLLVADDRKIAILRQDTSNGSLWRISIDGQPDIKLNSLDLLGDELNSASGARPVVFAAATDNVEINKIQSSLRLSGARTARPVPIVLSGTPKDSLQLLRRERLDVAGMAHTLRSAATFKEGTAYYRQANVHTAAGASFSLSLWASSKEKLLRIIYAFTEFSAARHPQFESIAEIAARFRDYLFDRGYDFDDVGIAFGVSESLTRQWAEVLSRSPFGMS